MKKLHGMERWNMRRPAKKVSAEVNAGYRGRKLKEHSFLKKDKASGPSGIVIEAAITARMKSAWKKFRELESILTRKGLSLKLKGKIYSICVRSVMLYGSETWALKGENVQRMERAEMQMVRLMCGVKLKERKRNEELRRWLGIETLM